MSPRNGEGQTGRGAGSAARRGAGKQGKRNGSRSKVVRDALLLDENSRSDTYQRSGTADHDVNGAHEATVSKVGEDQLFYLMSHGIREDQASKLIVNAFIEPISTSSQWNTPSR